MDAVDVPIAVGSLPGRDSLSLHIGANVHWITQDEAKWLAAELLAKVSPVANSACIDPGFADHKRTWSVPVFHQDIP